MFNLKSLLLLTSTIFLLISCGRGSRSSICTTCKLFVTAANFQGNFGTIASADAFCTSDANYPGTGKYKALLSYEDGTRRACSTANCSGGISERIDWVLKSNTTYTRLDGTIITTTNTNGLFIIPFTNSYSGLVQSVWTGTSSSWLAIAGQTCANWTSTSGTAPPAGSYGETNQTGITAIAPALGGNCSVVLKLLCVEQ